MLFSSDYPGIVIHIKTKGIEILSEDDNYAYVKASSGEVWHDFVLWCLDQNLGGIENLSLIPGCVGAAPIQNIGAYGVELKDVFTELEAMDLEDGSRRIFTYDECRFAYRDSIFKGEEKNHYAIISITLRLNKQHVLNTSYGAIEEELSRMGVKSPGIRDISNAVINIRKSKLPDPAEIGNAGSFFKNPEIAESYFEELKAKHPEIVAYKTSTGMIKIAAGWLIEKCGWKGIRSGQVGMHAKQALVLVNYGGASGEELIMHADKVIESVHEKFGILLEKEVNVI